MVPRNNIFLLILSIFASFVPKGFYQSTHVGQIIGPHSTI